MKMAKKVTDLKAGDRIKLNYGCMHGSEFATVVGVDSDRWGFSAELVTDAGAADRIHGEETLLGIGWSVTARQGVAA